MILQQTQDRSVTRVVPVTVRSNQHALQCGGCDSWNHRACLDMSKDEYFRLSTSDDYWFCRNCILPDFTDSFFSCEKSTASESSFISLDNSRSIQTHDSIDSPQNESTSEEPCDIFINLRELSKGNSKKPIMCHLNINSLRYKFNDLKPILTDKLCDILIISETKLDDSFNDNLFVINGYKFERKDRNAKGGGLFVYYRSYLPIRKLKTLECEQSESIFLELRLKNRTWGISCNYRPHPQIIISLN